MAIQNFLSGGFYGKLGDVVGQRWHNKRTIRAHVIPFNPRTEKQQNNRQLFALATALAQEAYQINKGNPEWDTSQMGQFSLMVGTAKRRLQKGMSPAEALPLHPDGVIVDHVLSNPSASWSNWPSSVTISDDSYIFPSARTMEIIIHCRDETESSTIFFKDQILINPDSYFTYTFNQSLKYSLPSGSTVQAITIDDSTHGGSSIQLLPFTLTQPSKPNINIHITFPGIQVEIPNQSFKILTYFGGYTGDYDINAYVYAYDDWSSTWHNIDINLYKEGDEVGNIYFDISDDYRFPIGSKIIGGSHSSNSETCNITFIWQDWPFTFP